MIHELTRTDTNDEDYLDAGHSGLIRNLTKEQSVDLQLARHRWTSGCSANHCRLPAVATRQAPQHGSRLLPPECGGRVSGDGIAVL